MSERGKEGSKMNFSVVTTKGVNPDWASYLITERPRGASTVFDAKKLRNNNNRQLVPPLFWRY